MRRLGDALGVSRIAMERLVDAVGDRGGPAASVTEGRPRRPTDATRVRLCVLGPLRASRGVRTIDLGGAMQRTVLGLLALAPNEPTSRSAIIEVLWPNSAPQSAVNLVQTYVGRLRRQLEPARQQRSQGGIVASWPGGYRLSIAEDQLDLLSFRRVTTQARRARAERDPVRACDLYVQALELWRGPPLSDVEPLRAYPGLAALDLERIAVTLEFADTAIAGGEYARAIPRLDALAAAEPLHGSVHARLMAALAGGGHQARALRVYEDIRHRLADELGVDPDRELVETHRRILRGELGRAPAVVVADLTSTAPGPTQQPVGETDLGPATRQLVPCLLPPDVPRLVGRVNALATAKHLVGDRAGPAILVVTGPAGVGKTAFAVGIGHTLASRFPDGQLYVDLQGFRDEPTDPAAVLGTFLRALGVRGGAVPSDTATRVNLYRTLLARRKALVVLDNAADTAQIRDLVPNGPGCATIITSRTSLAALGACRMSLSVLAESEALSLLRNMIGQDRIAAEPEAALSIVTTCGRLPLAVWVAGARLAARPHWPLAAIARALADEHRKLDVLTVGDVAVRASLELTYRSMKPAVRHALRMLSLIPAPDFTAWSLAALLDSTPVHADRLLDDLVDVHLVEVGGVSSTTTRYRLHDLVRTLARERATCEDPQADRDAALSRLLSASLHLADTAATQLSTDFQGSSPQHHPRPWTLSAHETKELLADPLAWFRDEHAFLVSVAHQALETSGVSLAAHLATSLTTFFQIGSHFDEWERLQTRALEAAQRASDGWGASKLYRCLGELTTILDRYPEAVTHFERALRYADTNDPVGAASATAGLGYVHRLLGRYDSAVAYFSKAADLARSTDNVNCLVYATHGIGVIDLEHGRLAAARERFEECLTISRVAHYRPGEARALNGLGLSYRAVGANDLAAECFRRAASTSIDLGDRLSATHARVWLGDVQVRQGHHREGRRLLAQSLWTYREFGNIFGEAAALYGLAGAQLEAGRPDAARRRAEAAVGLWRRIGATHWLAVGLDVLAEASQRVGDTAAADEAAAQARAIRQKLEN
jgi:DNA-binding SARP family transcriptional activator/tetratricopeptide (TPR) repeat protein